MFTVPTAKTSEKALGFPVFRRYKTTSGTLLAGVAGRNKKNLATFPLLLVFEHTAERRPAFIQNGSVQPGLGLYIIAGSIQGALCRFGHVLHLQSFEDGDRVVFADLA